MKVIREWSAVVVQLVGAAFIVVGFAVWLGSAAAWLAAGAVLLIVGLLLDLDTPEEVTDDAEGPGTSS